MTNTKPETSLGLILQAFKFLRVLFVPLTFICALYSLPTYFFVDNLETAFLGWVQDKSAGSAFKWIVLGVVLTLLLPFRQAAQIGVMNAKRLGQEWTLAETFWLGVRYWRPLFVVNLIRAYLIVALVLVVDYSAVSSSGLTASLTGVAVSKGMRELVAPLQMVGALYIVVCLAYFDFLIVLKAKSALDALVESVRMVWKQSGKLLIQMLALSIILVLLLKGLKTQVNALVFEGIRFFLIVVSINLTQALCFVYFWNARDELNPKEERS